MCVCVIVAPVFQHFLNGIFHIPCSIFQYVNKMKEQKWWHTQLKRDIKSSDKGFSRECQYSGTASINNVMHVSSIYTSIHSLTHSLTLKLTYVYVSWASKIIFFLDTFNMVMLFTISKSNKLNWFIYFILFFVSLRIFYPSCSISTFVFSGWPLKLVMLLYKLLSFSFISRRRLSHEMNKFTGRRKKN